MMPLRSATAVDKSHTSNSASPRSTPGTDFPSVEEILSKLEPSDTKLSEITIKQEPEDVEEMRVQQTDSASSSVDINFSVVVKQEDENVGSEPREASESVDQKVITEIFQDHILDRNSHVEVASFVGATGSLYLKAEPSIRSGQRKSPFKKSKPESQTLPVSTSVDGDKSTRITFKISTPIVIQDNENDETSRFPTLPNKTKHNYQDRRNSSTVFKTSTPILIQELGDENSVESPTLTDRIQVKSEENNHTSSVDSKSLVSACFANNVGDQNTSSSSCRSVVSTRLKSGFNNRKSLVTLTQGTLLKQNVDLEDLAITKRLKQPRLIKQQIKNEHHRSQIRSETSQISNQGVRYKSHTLGGIDDKPANSTRRCNRRRSIFENYRCQFCPKRFVIAKDREDHEYEHVGKGSHLCEYCNKSFKLRSERATHEATHSGDMPYECLMCSTVFESAQERNDHRKSCLPKARNRLFPCRNCGKLYVNEGYFAVHLKSQCYGKKPSGVFQCRYCSMEFVREGYRDFHEKRMHINREKPSQMFQCQYCEKQFTQKSSKVMHEKCHIGPVFPCSTCGKNFATELRLFKHAISHKTAYDYKCDQCEKAYKTETRLNEHKKLHQHPFQCNICGKKLISRSGANYHMLTHSTNRPKFKCQYCDKEFISIRSKQTHELVHTDQTDSNICKLCGKKCISAPSLKFHENRIHGNKFVCMYCGKRYGSRSLLQGHEATHLRRRGYHTGEYVFCFYLCQFCGRLANTKSKLLAHERQYHDESYGMEMTASGKQISDGETIFGIRTQTRQYQCRICSKTFRTTSTLRAHFAIHSLERIHRCYVCDKAYTTSGQKWYCEKRHEKPDAFKCAHCPAKFNNIFRLKVHRKRYHPKCTLTCCKSTTIANHRSLPDRVNESDLAALNRIKWEKKYVTHEYHPDWLECVDCCKFFKKHSSFFSHMRTIHPEKPRQQLLPRMKSYECSECEKVYDKRCSYYWHMRRVHPETMYKCKYCGALYLHQHVCKSHELSFCKKRFK